VRTYRVGRQGQSRSRWEAACFQWVQLSFVQQSEIITSTVLDIQPLAFSDETPLLESIVAQAYAHSGDFCSSMQPCHSSTCVLHLGLLSRRIPGECIEKPPACIDRKFMAIPSTAETGLSSSTLKRHIEELTVSVRLDRSCPGDVQGLAAAPRLSFAAVVLIAYAQSRPAD